MTLPRYKKQWMSLPADTAGALARYRADKQIETETDAVRRLVRIALDLDEPAIIDIELGR